MKQGEYSREINACLLALNYSKWMEEEMATHSSILAGKIPQTDEPGGLQPMGLQRIRHDWRDRA